MEWVIIGGLVFSALVILAIFSERKKQRGAKERAERYNDSINHERYALLAAPDRTILKPIEPSDYGYRPVAKENLIAVQENASRYEHRNSGAYRTSGASISIPIAKGVRYRVGSGRIRSEKSWQVTATGRLLVTDKAIVFESPQKNERITWGQIADVELMVDGYQIAKRSGPPRTFIADSPDPKFAAVLEWMLTRVE